MEYLGGGGAVYVFAGGKGAYHLSVAADIGHQAQLYLGVVTRHNQAAGVGDERTAYEATIVGAHRYVLQVGVQRREAPGGSLYLVEGGVHLAGARVDGARQSLHIGGEQLLEAADVENDFYDWICGGIRLEGGLGGGPCSALGLFGFWVNLEVLKEHGAHLRGRADVERHAGELISLLLEVGDAGGECSCQRVQVRHIDAHAFALNACEDGHERALHLIVELP